MNIDTTSCRFGQIPRYFATISAGSSHWVLTGYDSIYIPYNTSFRVYTTSLVGWNATDLITYANLHFWNVNWVGMYN